MHPKKQSIAIAEFCGFTVLHDRLCDPKPEVRNGVETGDIDMNPVAPLPDYTIDLNAMHDAEPYLDEDQRRKYFFYLFGTQKLEDADLWLSVHNSADKKSKAYLQAIDKWVDNNEF